MVNSEITINKMHLGDYENLVATITNDIIGKLETDNLKLTLAQTDIVDNLDSADPRKALSAHMGKVIKYHVQDLIDTVYSNIVDNTTSTSNKHFLSARIGNLLSERIRKLEEAFLGSGIGAQNLPSGVILMWSGTIDTIPAGWLFCDGTNGTPDLRDKFIKGIPNNGTNPGTSGGNNFLELEEANLPPHSHNMRHTHTTIPHGHGNHHTHAINLETGSSGIHNHAFVNDNTDWLAFLQKNNTIIRTSHSASGDHVTNATQYIANGSQTNYVFSRNSKNCSAHQHKLTGNTYESTTDTDIFEVIVNVNNEVNLNQLIIGLYFMK